MEKLTEDILTKYEPLSGFEREILTKQSEIKGIDEKIDNLKATYAKEMNAIEDLLALHKEGIAHVDVIAFKQLVDDEGWNPSALKDKVKLHDSLSNITAALRKDIKDLETKNTLEPEVIALEGRRAAAERRAQEEDIE